MVKVREDLTGKTFGRLTVIKQVKDNVCSNGTHEAMWLVECNCKEHTQFVVRGHSLKSKMTQSCGCLRNERRLLYAMKNSTSGVIGVTFHNKNKSWNARINHDGKRIHLGAFKNKEDAIKARRDAEIKYGYCDKNLGRA